MRLAPDRIWICTIRGCLYSRAAADRGSHPGLTRCPLHRHYVMQPEPGGSPYLVCGIRGCRYSPGMLAKGRHPWLLADLAVI
jgi:hypothetical protein